MSAIRTPSGVKAIARISVRDAANALKVVALGHIRDASNVLRSLASVGGMTAIAEPDSAFGYGNSHSAIRISTSLVAVSIQGGTGPYTYAWAADSSIMEAVSPTSASTIFRSVAEVSPSDTASDAMTCTVTDAHGNTAQVTVPATVTNFGT